MLGDPAAWRAVGWLCLAPVTSLPALASALGYVYGLFFLGYPLLRHVDYQTVRGSDGSERHVGLPLPGSAGDGPSLQLLVAVCGAGLLLLAPWLLRRALVPQVLLLRALLGPNAAQDRIRILEETRARAVDDAVAAHEPDAAVVDIRLPPHQTDEGLRAAVAIRRERPGVGVLIFSQYVETRFAADLLADNATGVGYLLKERVVDIGEFTDALHRVAEGGTALDPEVVSQLLGASRRTSALEALTGREREVLALMAEGRTNSSIAAAFVISERAVEKHISHIFSKFGLTPSEPGHRRVLAVLRYLES